MLQRLTCGSGGVASAVGAIGAAQDRATVQMRDGSKFEGRIEELTANGELFVRVSQHDQRRVAVGERGADRQGRRRERTAGHRIARSRRLAAPVAAVERLEPEGTARGDSRRRGLGERERAAHLRVPRCDGREQTFASGAGVARLPGGVSVCAITGTAAPTRQHRSDLVAGIDTPGAIRVAGDRRLGLDRDAGAPWRGDLVQHHAAKCNCRKTATIAPRGRHGRMAPGAPLPTVNAGALIGRVGNSQPFGIGDQASVPMPFDGVLLSGGE